MKANTKFPEIPRAAFEEFHRQFDGEDGWWNVCYECDGQCERYAIGSLMPGEKRFIADRLRVELTTFENLYLDRIVTPLGEVDVLKMKEGCPFLDSSFRCTIKHVKVVLCDTYPIAFTVEGDEVKFLLDAGCPFSRVKKAVRYFEEVGIPALKKLSAPVEWYRAVALYDRFSFDYTKIKRQQANAKQYESFSLDQILAARVDVPAKGIPVAP